MSDSLDETRSLQAENQQLRERLLRAEQQLQELRSEQALLEALMETVPDDIYFKDRQGKFLRINRAKALRSGLTDPKLARGRTDADFFQVEHADASLAQEQAHHGHRRGPRRSGERLVWPDGHVSWVSATKVPLHDLDGNVIGTVGISRDITKHHDMEEALQAERDRLRT